MLTVIGGFVQELRRAGIPVSMVEAIDAMQALEHTDLANRDDFKAALGATLIKNERHFDTFETVFEVYFALLPSPAEEALTPEAGADGPLAPTTGEAGLGGEADLDALADLLFQALADGDLAALRAVARRSVAQLSGMEPGRPVGGTYYVYRTIRPLDLENVLARLLEHARAEGMLGRLEERLLREEYETRIDEFRREVSAEIRRRLVADRGPEAVARTLRRPLLEEIDLMHATTVELKQLERAVHPLTRKLASRLARRRRVRHSGRLDFRRTIRASLSSGGVPVEPRFRKPHPSKPEILLLCDISGSMATFARFTLQFTYAMASQFSRLRTFAFIDALDEVTDAFRPGGDFGTALQRISSEAEVVWLDGHSDYGHALQGFSDRYTRALTPRSVVIVAGDARSNYRPSRAELLADVRARSRALYWLNPEPIAYWDTGDSVMSQYEPHCDGVYEVRSLRQLEDFVERISLPRGSAASAR